jgi:uncharacterized phage-associated protein
VQDFIAPTWFRSDSKNLDFCSFLFFELCFASITLWYSLNVEEIAMKQVRFKFDFDRTMAAIVFLAQQGVPDLDKYKIGKLLFLADKYHLVRFGRVITGDHYCAMEHGPAPSRILDILNEVISAKDGPHSKEAAELVQILAIDKKYKYPRISANNTTYDLDALSESDLMALNHIVEHYGAMTFPELRAITHEMCAYKKAWASCQDKGSVEMAFEDFFDEDSDAIQGAKEEMLETFAINERFAMR